MSIYNECTEHSALSEILLQNHLWIWLAGAAASLLLLGTFLSRRKSTTLESIEKLRRTKLNVIGRITDGTVIDAHEAPATRPDGFPAQLVVYRYDVAGVSYEASQDVTSLRHYVDLHTCRIGLPASVKYDSGNPANSIVIAENWSGLRL